MSTFFKIKQGNRLPRLEAIIADKDGNFPLAGKTLTFYMRPRGRKTGGISGAAIVVDLATSRAGYEWAAGDTATPGLYDGEFKVTDGAGLERTFPVGGYIKIKITRSLG